MVITIMNGKNVSSVIERYHLDAHDDESMAPDTKYEENERGSE